MVPQAISWGQLDFPTKWVVQAPNTSPQITINIVEISKYHNKAIIRFPLPHRHGDITPLNLFLNMPAKYANRPTTSVAGIIPNPYCSHDPIYKWPSIPGLIQCMLYNDLVSNQPSSSNKCGDIPSSSNPFTPTTTSLDCPHFDFLQSSKYIPSDGIFPHEPKEYHCFMASTEKWTIFF